MTPPPSSDASSVSLPPPEKKVRWGRYFILGLGLGVFVHYLLYRISLPVEPFIYVSF